MKFRLPKWRGACFCALFLALGVSSGRSTVIIFTNRAAFLNALMPGYFEDDFQSIIPGTNVASLVRNGQGFTVTHTSPGFSVYGTSGGEIGAFTNTGGMLATMNPGTISAVGANFFLTDVNDLFASGKLTISLIQSGLTTTMDLMPFDKTTGAFLGFLSDLPVISLGVSAGSAGKFTTYDNFIVGIPEPQGLLWLGFATWCLRRWVVKVRR